MLELKDFEGASSLDAPGFDGVDARNYGGAYDYSLWSLGIVIVHDVLKEIGNSLRSMKRGRRVRKLRREILPRFPDALVCPLCLHIIKQKVRA
jgi:hypothetical protein